MAEDFTGPTIPANRRPNPALDYVALRDAQAMAIRAFWRGMVLGWFSALAGALVAVLS